jgi:tight adherence protein B
VVRVLRLLIAVIGTGMAGALARTAWRWPARARLRVHRTRGHWRVPARPRAWLARALLDAGVPSAPEDVVTIGATGVAVVALLAAALNPLLAPIAVVTVVVGAPIGLVLARGRAQRAFVDALPEFVELVAARLRSGHTVHSALADAVDRSGPVSGDVARMCSRMELGASLDDVLARWVDERGLPPVRAVAGALSVAAHTGGAAAGALDGLARSMRDMLGAQAEASALSAQARLSALVVGVAPIAYLGFAAGVDPRSITLLVTTGFGRVCIVLGFALDAVAAWWMHRIVRSAP